uniref:Uncharacterized protein n=1 Tax=Astyanax mexicanus TaxID=7994 RepID=A0A3B1IL01_ASTMX
MRILIHGSLGGLSEDSEILQTVILQDRLMFIMKTLSGTLQSLRSQNISRQEMKPQKILCLSTGPQEPPEDIGIVIDGVTVSQELSSVASACASPLGLMSVLYLAFPKHLQFSFEVLQEIFMPFEQQEMSPKVQNLCGRLQSLH